MKKYIFIAVAGILALSACTKINDDLNAPRQMTFTAGFGDGAQTRATLSGKSVSFDANDKISILSKNNTNTKFTTTAGGASADFTGTANNDVEFYAVYPYTAGLTLNYLTGVISGIKIPSDQSAAATSACGWDPAAAIACTTTTDATLTFHNVCALLKITNGRGDNCYISVNGTRASGGHMSTNYSETFSLDTSDGSLSGGGQDYVEAVPVPNGKTIYLAIAPGEYTNIEAGCQNGFNYWGKSKSGSFTFEAGKIYDLGNTSTW